MSKNLLILFIVGVLAGHIAQAQSSALDDPYIVRYLSEIDKYKTLKFVTTEYSGQESSPGEKPRSILQLTKQNIYKGIIDFKNGNYHYHDDLFARNHGNKVISRGRSWFNGELREYIDDESPGLEGMSAGYGVVKTKDFDAGDAPRSPRELLGHDITRFVGNSVNLWDLITTREVKSIAPGHFRINNVFQWRESFGAFYDLEFVLDDKHGYLPSEIKFLERGAAGERPRITLVVNRFSKLDDLWMPVDFTMLSSREHRWVLDTTQLELNTEFAPADFELSFPKGKLYVLAETRELMRDGKMIEQLDELPSSPQIPSRGTAGSIWYWVIPALLVIGVLWILRNRLARNTPLGLFVLYIAVSGCGPHGEPDWTGKLVELSPGSSIAIEQGDRQEIVADLGADTNTTAATFALVNVGNSPIVLHPNIGTTCGCTLAVLSTTTLSPGQSCQLSATIENPSAPSQRIIGLTVRVLEPSVMEIPLTIVAEFKGDWYVDVPQVKLKGSIGDLCESTFSVYGTPNLLSSVKLEAPPTVRITELPKVRKDCRVFRVQGKAKSLQGAPTPLGSSSADRSRC